MNGEYRWLLSFDPVIFRARQTKAAYAEISDFILTFVLFLRYFPFNKLILYKVPSPFKTKE